MPKFRKKSVVVEAVRWEGCTVGLTNGVGEMGRYPLPEGLALDPMALPPVARVSEVDAEFDRQAVPAGEVWRAGDFLYIGTLEGTHRADPGDWIIRGVKGELYPCKSDIFAATYEPAEELHMQAEPAGYNPGFEGGFGWALAKLKDGFRIARHGWNGVGMFAYLVPAASYPVQTGAAKEHFGDGAMVPYRAYLALKTAQGDVATWVPSCSDVLADDWAVVA